MIIINNENLIKNLKILFFIMMFSLSFLQTYSVIGVEVYEHKECIPGKQYKYMIGEKECVKKCLDDGVNYEELFCCDEAELQSDGTYNCFIPQQGYGSQIILITAGLVVGVIIVLLIQNIIKKRKGGK